MSGALRDPAAPWGATEGSALPRTLAAGNCRTSGTHRFPHRTFTGGMRLLAGKRNGSFVVLFEYFKG